MTVMAVSQAADRSSGLGNDFYDVQTSRVEELARRPRS
jgi:hypothetical protein